MKVARQFTAWLPSLRPFGTKTGRQAVRKIGSTSQPLVEDEDDDEDENEGSAEPSAPAPDPV